MYTQSTSVQLLTTYCHMYIQAHITHTQMQMPILIDTQKHIHIHSLTLVCALSHKSIYLHMHSHRPTHTWILTHARVEPTNPTEMSSQPQINFSAGWL